mgnify:CR=1 FL=1
MSFTIYPTHKIFIKLFFKIFIVFSDFNEIKTAIKLDDDFVVARVTNSVDNSYYYIGENGVIYKK